MKRKLSLICVLTVIFLSLASFSVSAESGSLRVYDNAGIITEDKARIESVLSDFESECGIPIRLVTTYGYESVSLSDIGFVYGENLIVLEINYDNYTNTYYYYLDTYGNAYYEIDTSEVDRILDADAVCDNIKGGNFAEGVEAFAKLTKKAYQGKLQEPLWNTVLVSFIIAFVIGAVTVICVVYNYKRKLKAPSYPLDRYAKLNLSSGECSDVFIGSTVSKVRINTSNGRSGGGLGGRSGGGRRGGR